MNTQENLEDMVKFLEDKIEDMAETIYDLRHEVKILTDVIRDMERESNNRG
jgi:prefoldin subunit 5